MSSPTAPATTWCVSRPARSLWGARGPCLLGHSLSLTDVQTPGLGGQEDISFTKTVTGKQKMVRNDKGLWVKVADDSAGGRAAAPPAHSGSASGGSVSGKALGGGRDEFGVKLSSRTRGDAPVVLTKVKKPRLDTVPPGERVYAVDSVAKKRGMNSHMMLASPGRVMPTSRTAGCRREGRVWGAESAPRGEAGGQGRGSRAGAAAEQEQGPREEQGQGSRQVRPDPRFYPDACYKLKTHVEPRKSHAPLPVVLDLDVCAVRVLAHQHQSTSHVQTLKLLNPVEWLRRGDESG